MISIVIPTFNEVENIVPLLKKLTLILNDFEYEIVVVDDDSPDGTSDEVNKYMRNNKRIKLITRIGRSGLSSAIKEGLIFAQGKYLLVHGSADDNVHYQNTMEMTNALVNANKQFDLFIYPNKNHGIYGGNTRLHLFTKMTNFIKENL